MTITITPTREAVSLTRVEVRRPPAGGRSEVTLSGGGPVDRPVVRPMLLASDEAGARVSLVPEGALLLAGDRIRIEIVVGPGAHLDLVEPGGTVAYAMPEGSASWDVVIDLAPAAVCTWAGEPFVVAEGARVRRRTTVRLGWSARLALRETLVLGRHGERAGRLDQHLTAALDGGAQVLAESLTVGPASSRLLLGDARVVSTVSVLGARLAPTMEGTRLDLEHPGTLVRGLGRDCHSTIPDLAWASARTVVTSGGTP